MGNSHFLIKHYLCEQGHQKIAIKHRNLAARRIDEEIIMIAYGTKGELAMNLHIVVSFDETLQ